MKPNQGVWVDLLENNNESSNCSRERKKKPMVGLANLGVRREVGVGGEAPFLYDIGMHSILAIAWCLDRFDATGYWLMIYNRGYSTLCSVSFLQARLFFLRISLLVTFLFFFGFGGRKFYSRFCDLNGWCLVFRKASMQEGGYGRYCNKHWPYAAFSYGVRMPSPKIEYPSYSPLERSGVYLQIVGPCS
jgi:hypothetical protein